MNRTRRRFSALVFAMSLGLGGCATLPSATSPQALRAFDAAENVPSDLGPTPDEEPDLLLLDFYTASAHPTNNYAGARSYLAPKVAAEWNPSGGPVIVDRLYVTAKAGGGADTRSYQVRGRMVGRLGEDGAYEVENAEYQATISMVRVDGQWRISSLPAEVVIERTELLNHYEPESLYFYNSAGKSLIPDRRWLYSRGQSVDTELIQLMLEGPTSRLSPAATPAAPEGAEFIGRNNGVYSFVGFQDLDPQERLRFGAQLTWMLANADVPQPYEVALDGEPVADGYYRLNPDDFADLNPTVTTTQSAPLYALADGRLLSVTSSEATPVGGALGNITSLTSADVSVEGFVAAVRREGNSATLLMGTMGGDVKEIVRANSVSRPSLDRGATAAWAAIDGNRVIRVSRVESTGAYQVEDVNADELFSSEALNGTSGVVSELQISPSGGRVAVIADGRLCVGVVGTNSDGTRSIVNVEEIGTELGRSALSVQWRPDGSLLVGTASPETPIWRVEYDGSASTSLPAGNISAPVVAVASSLTTMYATDGLAVRQLPVSGSGSGGSWRDVPGLWGVRSAPIVAD